MAVNIKQIIKEEYVNHLLKEHIKSVSEAEFKHINRDEHAIKLAIKDVEKKSRLKANRDKPVEYEQMALNKIMLSKVLGREKLSSKYKSAWEKLKKEYNLKEGKVNEAQILDLDFRSLLGLGVKARFGMGEYKLNQLADAFEEVGHEQAAAIGDHLNRAIELLQGGESRSAAPHLRKFIKACKDALKGLKESVNEMQVINKKTGKDVTKHMIAYMEKKITKKEFEELTGLTKQTLGKGFKGVELKEIDFKDQEAFDAYKKKHKVGDKTKVKIGGKETTAGEASGEKKKADKTFNDELNDLVDEFEDYASDFDDSDAPGDEYEDTLDYDDEAGHYNDDDSPKEKPEKDSQEVKRAERQAKVDRDAIVNLVLMNAPDSMSQEDLKSVVNDLEAEWKGSAENYDSVDDYLEDLENEGGLEGYLDEGKVTEDFRIARLTTSRRSQFVKWMSKKGKAEGTYAGKPVTINANGSKDPRKWTVTFTKTNKTEKFIDTIDGLNIHESVVNEAKNIRIILTGDEAHEVDFYEKHSRFFDGPRVEDYLIIPTGKNEIDCNPNKLKSCEAYLKKNKIKYKIQESVNEGRRPFSVEYFDMGEWFEYEYDGGYKTEKDAIEVAKEIAGSSGDKVRVKKGPKKVVYKESVNEVAFQKSKLNKGLSNNDMKILKQLIADPNINLTQKELRVLKDLMKRNEGVEVNEAKLPKRFTVKTKQTLNDTTYNTGTYALKKKRWGGGIYLNMDNNQMLGVNADDIAKLSEDKINEGKEQTVAKGKWEIVKVPKGSNNSTRFGDRYYLLLGGQHVGGSVTADGNFSPPSDGNSSEDYVMKILKKAKIVESVNEAKFNFTKTEIVRAAAQLALAIAQVDKAKVKIHNFEYDEGRGAGFDLSLDGEKHAGGSYGISANGDVINHAVGGRGGTKYGTLKSSKKDFIKVLSKIEFNAKGAPFLREGKDLYHVIVRDTGEIISDADGPFDKSFAKRFAAKKKGWIIKKVDESKSADKLYLEVAKVLKQAKGGTINISEDQVALLKEKLVFYVDKKGKKRRFDTDPSANAKYKK